MGSHHRHRCDCPFDSLASLQAPRAVCRPHRSVGSRVNKPLVRYWPVLEYLRIEPHSIHINQSMQADNPVQNGKLTHTVTNSPFEADGSYLKHPQCNVDTAQTMRSLNLLHMLVRALRSLAADCPYLRDYYHPVGLSTHLLHCGFPTTAVLLALQEFPEQFDQARRALPDLDRLPLESR
jgi:hypothetical protein